MSLISAVSISLDSTFKEAFEKSSMLLSKHIAIGGQNNIVPWLAVGGGLGGGRKVPTKRKMEIGELFRTRIVEISSVL